jgi:hypothetical protein
MVTASNRREAARKAWRTRKSKDYARSQAARKAWKTRKSNKS